METRLITSALQACTFLPYQAPRGGEQASGAGLPTRQHHVHELRLLDFDPFWSFLFAVGWRRWGGEGRVPLPLPLLRACQGPAEVNKSGFVRVLKTLEFQESDFKALKVFGP